MQNNLSNNSFFIWLTNDPSVYSWKEFTKYMQHIDNYSLNKNEVVSLVNAIILYLNKLSEHIIFSDRDHDLNELISPIYDKNNQPTNLLLSYYLTCINLNKNNKNHSLYINTLPIIEHLSLGQDFLKAYTPDFFTKGIYRTKACEYTLEIIIKNECLLLDSNNLLNKVEFYSNKIQTYNKKIDWSKILKDTPSFLLSLIAQKQGYQLNDPQIFHVFHYLCQEMRYSTFDKAKIEDLAILFSEFLCKTSLFKNTLSHTNQVHHQVAKFFKITYKEDAYHKHEQFSNLVISFKGFDVGTLEKKLEKLQYFKIMGKHYLNSEEKEIFTKLNIQQQNKDISNKRSKI